MSRITDFEEKNKSLILFQNKFMNVVFKNNLALTSFVLRIILKMQDLEVSYVNVQEHLPNLNGHGVYLDIYASDGNNREYNIEIQRKNKGAEEKRARYHSSLMDANMLKEGHEPTKLLDTYVIFITEHDYFRKNLPLYSVERRIKETDEQFNDGAHIIYVNGADQNSSTELGKLMHDLQEPDPDKMYFKEVSESVRYYKETKEGQQAMRDVFEEERLEERIEIAMNLICRGRYSFEEIAEDTGLSVEKVRELANSKVS
jgi:predicted transposase/invertase (TIGR01784 family)